MEAGLLTLITGRETIKRHGNKMTSDSKKIRLCLLAALRCTHRSGSIRSLAEIVTKGLCLVLLAVSCTHHQVPVLDNAEQLSNPSRSLSAHPDAAAPKRANFEREHKSENAQHMADWVIDSGDNRGMPFAIVDKMDAKVFVFDAHGRLRGSARALLGLTRGDYTVPGIGNRKLSDIRPEERTTPAGRFVASLGFNSHGKDVLWVDYKNAVSLHRVITNNPKERRLERLATPTPLDKRISYGCINVPSNFYDHVVKPAFTGTHGIVYVLPETRSISEIFKSYYDVELRRGKGTTANLDEDTRPRLQQQDLRFGRNKARPYGRPERSVEEHKSRMTIEY